MLSYDIDYSFLDLGRDTHIQNIIATLTALSNISILTSLTQKTVFLEPINLLDLCHMKQFVTETIPECEIAVDKDLMRRGSVRLWSKV